MSVVRRIKNKYRIVGNLADQLHKYPDDIWDLLSRWYYHQSLQIYLDGVDPDEIEPGILSDMKHKYKTDDAEKAIGKCGVEHDTKAEKIRTEISKKYPEVKDIFATVLESNLADKFDKWMHSKQVYNPIGDPFVKYLDH